MVLICTVGTCYTINIDISENNIQRATAATVETFTWECTHNENKKLGSCMHAHTFLSIASCLSARAPDQSRDDYHHSMRGPQSDECMAYFLVHAIAVASCRALSVRRTWAISGTKGSSGFGSIISEQIEARTLEIDNEGRHWSWRISKQIPPLAF